MDININEESDCLRYTTPAAARNGRSIYSEAVNRAHRFGHGIICHCIHQTDHQGGIRIDFFRRYQHLQSNSPAHQSRQPLRSSPTGDQTKSRAAMPKHRIR